MSILSHSLLGAGDLGVEMSGTSGLEYGHDGFAQ